MQNEPPRAELDADDLERRVTTLAAKRLRGGQQPYVGQGADGARRSAQIDREELDSLGPYSPRHHDADERAHGAYLEASARAWDTVADELEGRGA